MSIFLPCVDAPPDHRYGGEVPLRRRDADQTAGKSVQATVARFSDRGIRNDFVSAFQPVVGTVMKRALATYLSNSWVLTSAKRRTTSSQVADGIAEASFNSRSAQPLSDGRVFATHGQEFLDKLFWPTEMQHLVTRRPVRPAAA